jgi:Flp pilus assembly protein TadG
MSPVLPFSCLLFRGDRGRLGHHPNLRALSQSRYGNGSSTGLESAQVTVEQDVSDAVVAAPSLLYPRKEATGHMAMRRYFSHRFFTRARDTEGANMMEAAIITPLLLILTFGTIEFASVFYAYLTLQNGASQATRYAVTGNTNGSMSRVDSIKYAFRQATPTLTVPDSAFTFQHMAVGGSAWVGGTGAPGEVEKVTVSYTWNFFTPLMRPFFPTGRMTITVDSVMRNESRFQ